MKRRKPKLKSGTRQYGKPKASVTVAPCPWDMGADGPANMDERRRVKEQRGERNPITGKMDNPNNVEGIRKLSVAEVYFRRGYINERQFNAAEALLLAWEHKDRTPPALNGDRVDSSPKPDDRTAIIVDHVMAYVRISRHVPKQYATYVYHVARDDRFLNSLAGFRKGGPFMGYLRKGLDLLADGMEKGGKRY